MDLYWEGAKKGHGSVFLSLQMNRTKGDEEEYWNSSKFKAFTFDDEDDELSQVRFAQTIAKSLILLHGNSLKPSSLPLCPEEPGF